MVQITVVTDLPGVGMNLQDTPTIALAFNLTKEPVLQTIWRDVSTNPTSLVDKQFEDEYRLSSTGPLSMAQANFAAFLALPHVSATPNATVLAIKSQDPLTHLPKLYDSRAREGYLRQREIILDRLRSSESAVSEIPISGRPDPIQGLLMKPLSRGTVTLNVSDPLLGPVVDYNTLSHPGDKILVAEMFKFIQA